MCSRGLPRPTEFGDYVLFRQLIVLIDGLNEPHTVTAFSGNGRSDVEVPEGSNELPL